MMPPPPPGAFKMHRRVEWRDLDPAQHVNNAVYLSYIEDCAFLVAEAHGWPLERMTAEGFAVLVRRHRVEYLQQAVLGDELEVATWASHVRRTNALRHFTVTRLADRALVARAQTFYAWVDLATGRPIRIPAAFIEDFTPNIVGQM